MLKYYKGLKQGDKIMYKGVYEGVDADKQSKKY